MITFILLLVILTITVYALYKLIIKPYRKMQKYKHIQEAHLMKFIPFFGFLQHLDDAFEKTGNQYDSVCKTFQKWPNARIVVSNLSDKCLIILLDPALIREFVKQEDKYIKHEVFVWNERRIFGNGTTFAEGAQWHSKRKIISPIFHYHFYEKFLPKMQAIIERELKVIHQRNDSRMEAKQFSAVIAGDIIIDIFFGNSFHQTIAGQPMSLFMNQLLADSVAQSTSLRTLLGFGILKYGLCEEDRKMNENIRIFRQIVRTEIEKRMSCKEEQRGILLEELYQKGLYNSQEGFSLDELIDEFGSLYVSGTDASAHHTAMCFYYFSLYPEIQTKIRQEIAASLILDNMNVKDLSNLKYLDHFVKQVFRHYNAMTLTPRTTTIDHYLADIPIYKDDILIIGSNEHCYNPAYFPDPEKFDPSRWEKLTQKELSFIFTPFGVGSRYCSGRNFALLEVKLIISKMISEFSYEVASDYKHLLRTDSFHGPINPINLNLLKINH